MGARDELLSVRYSHTFSEAQMKSLSALMDTYIPSIPYPPPSLSSSSPSAVAAAAAADYHLIGNVLPLTHAIDEQAGNSTELRKREEVEEEEEPDDFAAAKAFYELSASQAGVPHYAAGLMENKLKAQPLQVARWVLWLLSSRLGTCALLGKGTIGPKFPYLRSFVEIPSQEREKLILSAWSQSPYNFLRLVFNAFKIFAMFSLFSQADKRGSNLTWKAIGYCGPDPQKPESALHEKPPLAPSVFDAAILGGAENLVSHLHEAGGFEVLDDVSHLASLWKERSKLTGKPLGVRCDAVVVGSGSGGGVAAAILAQAGFKVLVLEKGRYFARADLSLLEGPSMDRMFEGGGILPTESGSTLILAGSTVGGGSAVNWSASFRTPPHVLEEWARDHGLDGLFASPAYAAAMDAIVARLGVQSETTRDEENLQNRILRQGCEKLGFHVDTVPRNCPAGSHACGWCMFGCWSGQKQATSETWLVDAAAAGAAIVAGAQVEAVLLRNSVSGKPRQNAGVVLSVDDQYLFVESRVTVVACGSLSSPLLLQHSGLQNPHIGKNLHLHPVQMLWGHFPDAPGRSYEGAILTSFSAQAAAILPRQRGCILQVPSLHPAVFSVLMPWLSARDFKARMHRYAKTVHVFALARDLGVGAVRRAPRGERAIEYDLHEADHAALLEGGEAALRVLIAAGACEVGTHSRHGDRLVITPSTSEADVEAFLRLVRSRRLDGLGTPLCSAHQMGTCRMGSEAATSVVEESGETWEVGGLFVADASVFPSSIGINPMVTIQSIAYCIAHSAVRHLRRT